MSCSRTQHGATCGDQNHDLSILSPMLYHYVTTLPEINIRLYLCVNNLPQIRIIYDKLFPGRYLSLSSLNIDFICAGCSQSHLLSLDNQCDNIFIILMQ